MKKFLSVLTVLLLLLAGLMLFAGPSLVETALKLVYPKPYGEIVAREAGEFSLDEDLVYAVMKAESGFDEDAGSHAGAQGLMQLTPQTFQWISSLYPVEDAAADPDDILAPGANIHCGCALLRLLLDRYGDLKVALCAYNAGMGNVDGWLSGGEHSADGKTLSAIPYPETAAYVERVQKNYQRYRELYRED